MLVLDILVAFYEKEYPALGDILSSGDPDSDCFRLDLHDVSHRGHVVSVGIPLSDNHILLNLGTDYADTLHPMALLVTSHCLFPASILSSMGLGGRVEAVVTGYM